MLERLQKSYESGCNFGKNIFGDVKYFTQPCEDFVFF